MGSALTRLWQRIMSVRDYRILMLGLDASGKTTILYLLKLGEIVSTIPTIGFNVETLKHHESTIAVWDLGYRERLVPLWRHYYNNTTGVIFVVDSLDYDRFPDAKNLLQLVMRDDQLRNVPVLVFANKHDLVGARTGQEIAEALDLKQLTGRVWRVVESCGITGEGLNEGMDWLVGSMQWHPAV